jgi:hypothetical protein
VSSDGGPVDPLPDRTFVLLVAAAAAGTALSAAVWLLALAPDPAVPTLAAAVAATGIGAGAFLAGAYALGVVVAALFVYGGGWDRLRTRLG